MLNDYKINNVEEVCNILKLSTSDEELVKRKYRRYKILNDVEVSEKLSNVVDEKLNIC